MEDNSNDSSINLKIKRKRDRLYQRMDSLIYIPKEYKKVYTQSFFDDNSYPSLLLEKKENPMDKISATKINNETKQIPNKSEENFSNIKINNNNNTVKQIDERIPLIKEEIEEIVNELEIFEVNNRKRKMIHIMEQIANCLDEDLIDVDEMLDFYFHGNRINAIEKEFNERQKRKYKNDFKLCEFTNKLLNDDNECYQDNKKIKENTFYVDRSYGKKKS